MSTARSAPRAPGSPVPAEPAPPAELARQVQAFRRFNRFYTRRIGVLQERHLHSPFSLTEARVIYELAHQERTTATELARELGLDAGYLSRILARFHRRGLIGKRTSEEDGRRTTLWLTEKGAAAFSELDAASRGEMEAILSPLTPAERETLARATATVEELLGDGSPERASYVLRPHRPGDMGWVVQRHGVLYQEEYGWDEAFEALIADIVARFIRNLDPQRERCWIAEKDGESVGCVFLVRRSKHVAQLRLLLVEPSARGLGIGGRLVDECIRFARQAGYRKITLWTNSVLDGARRIYERAGFELVESKPHREFGKDLVGQTWDLAL